MMSIVWSMLQLRIPDVREGRDRLWGRSPPNVLVEECVLMQLGVAFKVIDWVPVIEECSKDIV